jgi:hypothetical protein
MKRARVLNRIASAGVAVVLFVSLVGSAGAD